MDKEEYFEYLDGLRESGIITNNMYGVNEHLIDVFRIPRKEAHETLREWMETFSQRHPKN